MASTWDTVAAKIAADWSTVTVGTQTLTAYKSVTKPAIKRVGPIVWFWADPVENEVKANTLRTTKRMTVLVDGEDSIVSEALQTLAKYYLSYTHFDAINLLGAVDMIPEPWDEPVELPGGYALGMIAFNITLDLGAA